MAEVTVVDLRIREILFQSAHRLLPFLGRTEYSRWVDMLGV
jgi:hypothetical protein